VVDNFVFSETAWETGKHSTILWHRKMGENNLAYTWMHGYNHALHEYNHACLQGRGSTFEWRVTGLVWK